MTQDRTCEYTRYFIDVSAQSIMKRLSAHCLISLVRCLRSLDRHMLKEVPFYDPAKLVGILYRDCSVKRQACWSYF